MTEHPDAHQQATTSHWRSIPSSMFATYSSPQDVGYLVRTDFQIASASGKTEDGEMFNGCD